MHLYVRLFIQMTQRNFTLPSAFKMLDTFLIPYFQPQNETIDIFLTFMHRYIHFYFLYFRSLADYFPFPASSNTGGLSNIGV